MYTLKKSLGQHFLRDENIARKIVDSVRDRLPGGSLSAPCLLEVGPGAGALTKYLLEIEGADLKAVELDEEKIRFLEKTWPALQGKILHASILEMGKPFDGKRTYSA